jgi:hypothetical protein
MTPLRMFTHILKMCEKDTTETATSVKAMLQQYNTAANADKELDVQWYSAQGIKVIDELLTHGWASPQIKEQVYGRLSAIIPRDV